MGGNIDQLTPVERRAWLALSVATLAALLTVIDISIVNVAFPSIRRDLGASEAGLSWVLSGYSVAVGAFLLISGRLADQKGRRKLFLIGVAVFMVGSLLSGVAPSPGFLIAARVLQGVGASILSPASLSMILPEFPPDRHSTVIGIWGASAALGAAIGPTMGAILIDAFNWRWVFFVNVPVGLVIFVLTPRFVHESSDPDAEDGFDSLGVPAGTFGVALLLVAVVQGGEWGYGSPSTLATALVGLLLVLVLIRRSATHPHPLLDLDLFRIRAFWSAAVGQTLFSTAFIATVLFNTLLLQELWGWSVLAAGFGVVPGPALAALLGGPIGSVADRVGHRTLVVIGSASAACCPLWLIIRANGEGGYFSTLLPAHLMLGIGVACSFATFSSMGMKNVPPQRFATASATLRTGSSMGFAAGVAIAVAIFTSQASKGPLVAFDRTWLFMALTFASGAIFCALACPSKKELIQGSPS
ncbi:MAG: DHA2 family efflux MFS transporter permease subunit [Actinobacteria bacterium]|nr:DHA2 family efflux MFS transporter permease subunit [Actinomycetota bacterium]